MTRAIAKEWFEGLKVWRILPYVALVTGLVLATNPTWWMMVFGVQRDIDALLTLRCAAWFKL